MNTMIKKVQKITSKGQITLPILWRNKFKASQILLKTKGDVIEISSINLDNFKQSDYTVFDALRDNKGKGLKAIDLLKILRKIDN
ncbi:hypothetical protein KJ763_00645 [Patescibacteria group bacterium]|nr:hypothetical protein [Patescibacteria group bacterium]